jgi:hypothetical protein
MNSLAILGDDTTIFPFVLVSILLCLFSVLGSVPAEGVRPTPCVALTMKQTLF